MGRYKTWALDSGLDCGLDYGLDYGLNFGLDGRTYKLTSLPGLPDVQYLTASSLVLKVRITHFFGIEISV